MSYADGGAMDSFCVKPYSEIAVLQDEAADAAYDISLAAMALLQKHK